MSFLDDLTFIKKPTVELIREKNSNEQLPTYTLVVRALPEVIRQLKEWWIQQVAPAMATHTVAEIEPTFENSVLELLLNKNADESLIYELFMAKTMLLDLKLSMKDAYPTGEVLACWIEGRVGEYFPNLVPFLSARGRTIRYALEMLKEEGIS